jgi:hypothetical protein
VVIIGIDPHSISGINVYPVPNDGHFTVSLNSASSETYTLQVYNSLGVKIFENTNIEVNGPTTKTIDLRPIPDGVYSLVIENNDHQVVKRIIINK